MALAKSSYHPSITFLLLCVSVFKCTDCTGSTLSYKACKVPLNGGDGICVNLEKDVIRCPSLRSTLLEKNFTEVHSAVCHVPDIHKLNETRICCSVEEFIELYPSSNISLQEHTNFKLIPTLELTKCGQAISSTADRIIGGEDVFPGDQPWMTRLGMTLSGDDQVRFPCSGSIINERYIMTSAHCFKQGTLHFVRLAETDENIDNECVQIAVNSTICQGVQDHEPEDVIIHSGYTGKIGSTNDIALIRLKEPIRNLSSPFTRPVCLPFVNEFNLPDFENAAVSSTGAKTLVSVQGWGKESNKDNVGSSQLKQVYVPLRSNTICRHVFQRANLTVTHDQICVGGSKDKGSCAGDSGSPLLMYGSSMNKNTGMRMFQIGIVSYGRQQCGLPNSPVVYTRVRAFLQWILDNIRE